MILAGQASLRLEASRGRHDLPEHRAVSDDARSRTAPSRLVLSVNRRYLLLEVGSVCVELERNQDMLVTSETVAPAMQGSLVRVFSAIKAWRRRTTPPTSANRLLILHSIRLPLVRIYPSVSGRVTATPRGVPSSTIYVS
jgi:hypothetical protein